MVIKWILSLEDWEKQSIETKLEQLIIDYKKDENTLLAKDFIDNAFSYLKTLLNWFPIEDYKIADIIILLENLKLLIKDNDSNYLIDKLLILLETEKNNIKTKLILKK